MENRILCFESGGTKLVAGLFDEQGNVVDRRVLRRTRSQKAEDTVNLLCSLGKTMSDQYGHPVAIGWDIIRLFACLNTTFAVNTSILIYKHCIMGLVGILPNDTGTQHFASYPLHRHKRKHRPPCKDTGYFKTKTQETPPLLKRNLPGLAKLAFVALYIFHFLFA